jgi:hypothetical protein
MKLEWTTPPVHVLHRRLVQRLAREDPPAFLCHFYNIYFAHSAGGRMIGKKVSEMCLDGAQLNFYQYEGDLKELLEKVLRGCSCFQQVPMTDWQAVDSIP